MGVITLDSAASQDSQRPRFLRHLPPWVYHAPDYAKLSAAERWTLHILAGRADAPDALGNLMGAFCGRETIRWIGCSASTFWAHIRRLEEIGFIVTINRGGAGSLANVVAIPGRAGSLDELRIQRRETRGGKGGARPSKYEKLVSENRTVRLLSENRTLGAPANGARHPSENRRPPVRNPEATRPEIGGSASEIRTLLYPILPPIRHPISYPRKDVALGEKEKEEADAQAQRQEIFHRRMNLLIDGAKVRARDAAPLAGALTDEGEAALQRILASGGDDGLADAMHAAWKRDDGGGWRGLDEFLKQHPSAKAKPKRKRKRAAG